MNRNIAIESLENRRLLSGSFGHGFLGGVLSFLSGDDQGFHSHHDQFVVANVVSVDAANRKIIVSSPNDNSSSNTTYTVASDATITADGDDTTLDKFSTGARVALTLSSSDSTTVTAIAAHSQEVVGTISSIDTTADTITIDNFGGDSKTYPVGIAATIKINGSTSTLSDLNDGTFVNLELSAFDAKTVTTIRAFSLFQHHHDHSLQVDATVNSVDTTAKTITVSTSDHGSSATTTYNVASNATITADGTATPLSSLLAGAKVELTISSTDASTVTQIEAHSQHVVGTLAVVDTTAKTIMLTSNGASTTYNLADTATITRDGVSATLADLVVGDRLNIQLSALDGTTVTAVSDKTAAIFTHHRHALGTVTAVDTTANTITIANFFSSTTTTTYALDPTAPITADGTTVTLGQLVAGARVNLLLTTTSTTTTVAAIIAIQQRVGGVISAVDMVGNTVTLTPHDGTVAQTYPVSSTATILLNGSTSTISALAAGDRAKLVLSALDGKTVLTLRAHSAST